MSKTEYILVETISTFRHRYVVEVPVGHKIWAEDSVAMGEVPELGQKYLGETTISSRVIDMNEIQTLAIEDCAYITDEIIMKQIKKWPHNDE